MSFVQTKKCSTCEQEKEIDLFYDRKYSDGSIRKQGQCKICLQRVKQNRRKSIKDIENEKAKNRKKKCLDCDNLIKRLSRTLRCRSCANKKRWIDDGEERKNKHHQLMIERWNCPEYRSKMSNEMKKRRNSLEFIQKMSTSKKYHRGRLSNLHIKISKFLELKKFGFVSEQVVDKYFVDELNQDKKIIVEINGDYIHANPKFYNENEIIRIVGSTYTAKEKWDYDQKRKELLESLGYNVITIWETDELEQYKIKISNLITKD